MRILSSGLSGLCVLIFFTSVSPARASAAEPKAAFAGDKAWLACDKSEDCTTVELGCYYWQPVNKKFSEQMKSKNIQACLNSIPSGVRPSNSCVNHVCVNDPAAVKDWTSLEEGKKIESIDKEIKACLGEKTKFPSQDQNRFAELREPFLKKIETLIAKGELKASTSLDQVAKDKIACRDVLDRSELIMDRAESLRDWEYSEVYPFPIDVHLDSVMKDFQKECSGDEDCVSGLTGCYRWVAVNKKYLKGQSGPHGGQVIEARSPRFCSQSHDPGSQPKAVCHRRLCRQVKAK